MIEQYKNIIIQCHNNPDADTIASGFAIQTYIKEKLGRQVKIIYSGEHTCNTSIQKFINYIGAKIEYIQSEMVDNTYTDLLILVDCQPNNSNLDIINYNKLAIIDHHNDNTDINDSIIYKNVNDQYTSCSALIWQLFRRYKYNISDNIKLGTALYYGLYTDSNRFQTNISVKDEEMRLHINYDSSFIRELQGSSISMDELSIISRAIGRYRYNREYNYAVTDAEDGHDNIMGIINDTMIDVDVIDLSTVYSIREEYIKISVRSCVNDISACEIAEHIASLIPNSSGGGRADKAGGKLSIEDISGVIQYKQWHLSEAVSNFLHKEVNKYLHK